MYREWGRDRRPPRAKAAELNERITAWECIGCGRIEGAQPCVGICEDRRTEFVYAADYDAAIAQLALAREALRTPGSDA